MRNFAAALLVFLASTPIAQAHVPAHCAAEIGALTTATKELAARKTERIAWISDWMASESSSKRPFTVEELSEFFGHELLLADAQVSYADAIQEFITCIQGS